MNASEPVAALIERPGMLVVRDPEDGTLVAEVAAVPAEEVGAAVDRAERAAAEGLSLPVHVRAAALERAAADLEQQSESFAQTIASEGIKTIREARSEVTRAIRTLRLSAEQATRLASGVIPFDAVPGHEHRRGTWQLRPLGVVAAVTPFNDPLNLVAHKIGPAVAAGNAIVVKPHQQTPISALRLADLLHAHLPDDTVQVLPGASETASALVSHPRVRLVSFTGSRAAGEQVSRAAGVKRLLMELESVSPVMVLSDADVELAVDRCSSGAWAAAGQNCLHVQRILVHDDLVEAFTESFVARAAELRVGPKRDEATEMGCLVSPAAAARTLRMVEQAVQCGARVLHGGTHEGSLFQPTVVADPSPQARLLHEEVFAPVTTIEPFSTIDQAVTSANQPDMGLHAALFTRDLDTAFLVADRLEVGGVMINDSTDVRVDEMPFGGVKGSGIGREGIPFAIGHYTEPKLVVNTRPKQ